MNECKMEFTKAWQTMAVIIGQEAMWPFFFGSKHLGLFLITALDICQFKMFYNQTTELFHSDTCCQRRGWSRFNVQVQLKENKLPETRDEGGERSN